MAEEKATAERGGFVRTTGWFGGPWEEFWKANGFYPVYFKDGRLFATPYDGSKSVDAVHWLERKEWWKKKLGIDYDSPPSEGKK